MGGQIAARLAAKDRIWSVLLCPLMGRSALTVTQLKSSPRRRTI
ncbi:hypothetical protein HED49_19790 [Ochrobactrum daejeonense]|nr:hypothetical protein [Brucella daejeonensis]